MHSQVLAFMSTNFRRRIDLLYLTGVALTYKILQEKKKWFKVCLTSEYKHTKFTETDFNINKFDGQSTINTR